MKQKSTKLREGDEVIVISGKDKGKKRQRQGVCGRGGSTQLHLEGRGPSARNRPVIGTT